MPSRRGTRGRGRFAAFLSSRGGVSTIEAALVLPVFLLMLFGLFYFAYAMFIVHETGSALLAGARYSMTHGAASDIPASAEQIEAVVRASSNALARDRLSVVVEFQPDNTPGSTVVLSATYRLPSFPLVPLRSALTIADQKRVTIMN